jgi:WhiB family redox-sensing transcriptional regulator
MFNTEKANCTSIDPELFFPVGEIKPEIESLLCRICMNCPINRECLEYALEIKVYGYWGGTTEHQRKVIRKKLKITVKPLHLGYP